MDEGRSSALRELTAAVSVHPLVNLTGPLGIGKTWLAERVKAATAIDLSRSGSIGTLGERIARAGEGLLVIDSADAPGHLDAVRAALDALPRQPSRLLVISRRPLLTAVSWTHSGAVTLTAAPMPDHAIEERAASAGRTDPGDRSLVRRLAGGVPLLADAACRALHRGVPATSPGAIADRMTAEILQRLERELPGRRRHALRWLSTVGAGDEQLMAAGPELFGSLADLSLVTGGPLGLTVLEPYRAVLELAYQWRKPSAHRTARTRAARYRRDLLTGEQDAGGRAGLVEQSLFLSGDPVMRSMLFPPAQASGLIEPARPGDADDIGRLMHAWSVSSGFDRRRAERLTERWIHDEISGFHLARDRDGEAVGLATLLSIGAQTADGMEPLLQQHTEELAGPARPGGLFLGAAYCSEPTAHAQLLRHIITHAVTRDRLVVSTASGDYQRLLHSLRFRPHGNIRDDVYRCGRPPEVYSNDFTSAVLPTWLSRFDPAAPSEAAATAHTSTHIAGALGRINDLQALARSPLLAFPRTPTAACLRAWLREAVQRLALSDEPADAEAGAVLHAYYLRRGSTHHQVASRLHLSRATYFRRLSRGHTALGALLVS